jgi:hypothetical protein
MKPERKKVLTYWGELVSRLRVAFYDTDYIADFHVHGRDWDRYIVFLCGWGLVLFILTFGLHLDEYYFRQLLPPFVVCFWVLYFNSRAFVQKLKPTLQVFFPHIWDQWLPRAYRYHYYLGFWLLVTLLYTVFLFANALIAHLLVVYFQWHSIPLVLFTAFFYHRVRRKLLSANRPPDVLADRNYRRQMVGQLFTDYAAGATTLTVAVYPFYPLKGLLWLLEKYGYSETLPWYSKVLETVDRVIDLREAPLEPLRVLYNAYGKLREALFGGEPFTEEPPCFTCQQFFIPDDFFALLSNYLNSLVNQPAWMFIPLAVCVAGWVVQAGGEKPMPTNPRSFVLYYRKNRFVPDQEKAQHIAGMWLVIVFLKLLQFPLRFLPDWCDVYVVLYLLLLENLWIPLTLPVVMLLIVAIQYGPLFFGLTCMMSHQEEDE